MAIKYILFLFVLLLNSSLVFGQENREKCLELVERGMNYYDQKKYPQAIAVFSKVELIAEKNQWPEILWFAKDKLGGSYKDLSAYGEALGYYREALGIIESNPDISLQNKVVALNNLATLYSSMGEKKMALAFYFDANKLIKNKEIPYEQKVLKINIANNYNDLGQYDKALNSLVEVKNIKTEPFAMNFWKATYAETLFYIGKVEEAKELAQALMPETRQRDKEGICNICILELLSKIAVSQNQINKAIYYAEEALNLTFKDEWGLRIERYNRLGKLYRRKGEHEIAFAYKDSTLLAKDSLSQQINHQLLQVNKAKFKVQEYQNQLKINKERYESRMLIMWIVIVLGLALFFFIYSWQKNRIAKQREKQINIENKQKITILELEQEKNEHLLLQQKAQRQTDKARLKQEQLKSKIAQKNRELSTAALYHSGRNELLEKIISSLADISAVSENKAIADYIKELKGHLKADTGWKNFTEHFEKVNPGFLKTLKAKHPELTKKDIRFLCYFYMNLGTKEICTIFNITPEAFRKRKQRLSKKMGLEKEDLYNYVLGLT